MSPAQIHLVIGIKLDQQVSKSTIKNELRRRLRSADLVQVAAGCYALRGASRH